MCLSESCPADSTVLKLVQARRWLLADAFPIGYAPTGARPGIRYDFIPDDARSRSYV